VSDSRTNEGIQSSGGSINVGGSLAVGRHARASSTHDTAASLDREALNAQLAELGAAIERNRTQLADADAAMANMRRLVAELEEREPEPSRVTSLLGRLRDGAAGIVEIATSVTALEQAVAAVL
jgi:chromosome segregation ATPase